MGPYPDTNDRDQSIQRLERPVDRGNPSGTAPARRCARAGRIHHQIHRRGIGCGGDGHRFVREPRPTRTHVHPDRRHRRNNRWHSDWVVLRSLPDGKRQPVVWSVDHQLGPAEQPTGPDPAPGASGQRFDLSAPVVRADWSTRLGLYRSSVWSTRVDLVVTDPGVIVAAVSLLNQTLERVDTVASRFRPDSEINALYRASVSRDPVPVSVDLLEAVDIALRAARLSNGAVDPTVGTAMCRLGYDRDFKVMERDVTDRLPEPGPVPGWRSVDIDVERSTITLVVGTLLDLGATAKAWAADRAATAIASRLGCGVLVSLGGDIAVDGVAPEEGFSVGIADVCGDPSAPVAVSIASGGLATSGISNRHWTLGGHPVHHLIDPATGLSVDSPWRTVSVAAGSCVDANTASTAAMVMGETAVSWLEQERLPARLVRLDGSTLAVAGWPQDPPDSAPTSTGSRSRTPVTP